MCRAATTRLARYDGAGLHLIDSFAGISPPQEEDDGRGVVMKPGFDGGAFASPLELVKHTLREFPAVAIHPGWIPAVFAQLPEARWCFVHLDVDLYEPTLACLNYFYPRLVDGGVIICDDYGAPLFPGAHRAWDEFLREMRPAVYRAGYRPVRHFETSCPRRGNCAIRLTNPRALSSVRPVRHPPAARAGAAAG